jgi:hypothetical protein
LRSDDREIDGRRGDRDRPSVRVVAGQRRHPTDVVVGALATTRKRTRVGAARAPANFGATRSTTARPDRAAARRFVGAAAAPLSARRTPDRKRARQWRPRPHCLQRPTPGELCADRRAIGRVQCDHEVAFGRRPARR